METPAAWPRFFHGPVLVAVAALAYALAFQGSRGLWEPDEGRYTNIACQMLRTGDFMVPAFNDEVPHFSKPPLTYWSIACGIRLLGRNEWGARLAHALAFAATLLVVFALARTIVPARAWFPPLVYASFPVPLAAGNVVTTDTLLALWEAVAMLGFVRYWERRTALSGRRRWLVVMWLGFGLAFLTKGPPGLLPLFVAVCFAALVGGPRAALRLAYVPALALFVLVGFGWYVLVVATHPGLLHYFIHDEIVGRVTTDQFGRNGEWYGAFVVYVPTLLLGTLPWTWVFFKSVRRLPGTLMSRAWWRQRLSHDAWTPLLALWVLLPLGVFCVSRSRLPLYVLPLFVPLALMAARLHAGPGLCRRGRIALAAWLALLLACKGVASLVPYERDSRRCARAIAAAVTPLPSEVVFVGTRAFWGLSLYLNCEVERVLLTPTSAPSARASGTLTEEMSALEPGTLLVVPAAWRTAAGTFLRRSRVRDRELATTEFGVLIAPGDDLEPTGSAARAPHTEGSVPFEVRQHN